MVFIVLYDKVFVLCQCFTISCEKFSVLFVCVVCAVVCHMFLACN